LYADWTKKSKLHRKTNNQNFQKSKSRIFLDILYIGELIYLNFEIENSEDLSDYSEIVKFAFLSVLLSNLGIYLFYKSDEILCSGIKTQFEKSPQSTN
jgi:hypothetical protein